MVVLPCMMPGDLILIARHLHKDPTAQIWDERLVVRQPGDRADRLRPEPEADAHRTRRQWILGESARQLDRADHPRPVVVSLHGMTGMRLNKEFTRIGIRSTFGMNNSGGDSETLPGIGGEFGFDDHVVFLMT